MEGNERKDEEKQKIKKSKTEEIDKEEEKKLQIRRDERGMKGKRGKEKDKRT